MCEVANKNKSFLYLTHQTSFLKLQDIISKGYVLPPRYVQSKEELKKRTLSYGFRSGYIEGVFMSLIYKRNIGSKIKWHEDETHPAQCILVFSLALLERDDYYFSLSDQSGAMTRYSYTRTNLSKVPPVNFNPEPGFYISKDHIGSNEIMFFEKVSLDFLEEIWLSPKTSLLSRSTVPNIPKGVKLRLHMEKYPIDAIQKVKLCGNMNVLREQKKYKAPFCRGGYLFVPSLSPVAEKDSGGDLHQTNPLSAIKKIALNCGINPDIVMGTNNRDKLNIEIRKKESEMLQFIIDNDLNIPENEIKFRKLFSNPKYFPPFDLPLQGKDDTIVDKQDVFYNIISDLIAVADEMVKYAIVNTTPPADIDKYKELYKEKVNNIQKKYGEYIVLFQAVYVYLHDEIEPIQLLILDIYQYGYIMEQDTIGSESIVSILIDLGLNPRYKDIYRKLVLQAINGLKTVDSKKYTELYRKAFSDSSSITSATEPFPLTKEEREVAILYLKSYILFKFERIFILLDIIMSDKHKSTREEMLERAKNFISILEKVGYSDEANNEFYDNIVMFMIGRVNSMGIGDETPKRP